MSKIVRNNQRILRQGQLSQKCQSIRWRKTEQERGREIEREREGEREGETERERERERKGEEIERGRERYR